MKKVLIALLMTVLFQGAQAYDYTSLSWVKVKWTDANGANHENLLTDKATDPRHIIALLQELACNPAVPGSKNVDGIEGNGTDKGMDVIYGDQWNNPQRYLGRVIENYPWEDHFTCILVELKDGATAVPTTDNVEDFEKTVKAVTLIPSVGQSPDNNLNILSITGNYDNFYFAAKGKPRKGAKCGNWERLSICQNGTRGTEDFIDHVRTGEVYKVTHDCDDIIADKHYFTLNPGGPAPYMRHLTMVVPQNRMKAWSGRDDKEGDSKGSQMTWYNPDCSPRIGLYLVTNKTYSVSRANEYDKPDVTITWRTNLKDKNGLAWTGTEKSDLYLVNEDGTEVLVKKEMYITDPNVQDFSYTFWNVEDNEVGRYQRFKVVCYPFDSRSSQAPHATEADSYIEVFVPGKKDELAINHIYRSRFEESAHKNSYKNTFIVNPITTNITRTLYRSDANGENKVAVATLKLEGGTYRKDYSTGQCNEVFNNDGTFEIAYNNPMDAATQLRYDNNVLVTKGSMKDGIEINDYFFADTQNGGDLSGGYVYTLEGGAEGKNPTRFEVPVYAADITSAYNKEYHINDITNDMGRFANGKSEANLDLTERGSVSFGDVDGEGDVMKYSFYDNGALSFKNTKDADAPTGENTFTGEMTTAAKDNDCVFNTYGTNSVNVEVPAVEVNFEQIESGRDEAKGLSSFGVTLNIQPALAASVAPYVYYYRVWRVEEGENMEKTVTLINNEADKHGASWATSYSNIKSQFPCGDAESSNAGVMRVRDIFQRPIDTDHESRMVSYVVRMYTTSDYQDQGLEMAAALGGDDDIEMFNPLCMISECENVVTFSNLIVTGVNDVTAQKQVSSVRYVNMLGAESSRPFEGINVVVTTYTDGTQSTAKIRK